MDDYVAGAIRDSVRLVALALDKVITECLGDPEDPNVLVRTIEGNVWSSSLRLSSALNSTPVQVVFDDRGHRVLPMALGVLTNGTWKVGGVYDPTKEAFTESSPQVLFALRRKCNDVTSDGAALHLAQR
jgi:hypothetical protein